jgi:hypothetical protein
MEDLNSIKNIVKSILETDEKARNSDKYLIVTALRQMGFKIYIDYGELDRMPSWESFRRCRQLLQAENKELRGDEAIGQLREKKQEEYKEFFGKKEDNIINCTGYERKTRGVVVEHTIKKGVAMF